MRPKSPVRLAALAGPLLLLLSIASASSALQISFETRDLPDVIAGEDLRELRLSLDDFDLGTGFGVSVLFSPALYSDLAAAAPDPDWDLLLLQPDPLLPDFGRYDIQAQVDDPSVAAPFVLSFVWLGSGEPGANPFEVYDPAFATIETGATTSVPEPATGLLLLGVAPLVATRTARGRGIAS